MKPNTLSESYLTRLSSCAHFSRKSNFIPELKHWVFIRQQDKYSEFTDMRTPAERMVRMYLLNNCFQSRNKKQLEEFRANFEAIIQGQFQEDLEPLHFDSSELKVA